jgi:citrate lyase beta subunit
MPMDDASIKLRDLARKYGERAVHTLVDIMDDEDAKPAARVQAARSVLERGFGTPERHTTTDMNVNVFDARQSHFDALKKLAAEPTPIVAPKTIEGSAVRLPPPAKSKYEE